MSEQDVERLRALAGAATPGPWVTRPPHNWDHDEFGLLVVAVSVPPTRPGWPTTERIVTPAAGEAADDGLEPADAAYIAAVSPDVVTALLDEIESVESMCDLAMTHTETWQARALAAEAKVARVEALRASKFDSIPVWGPDERGLMILDGVDLGSVLDVVDRALEGPPEPACEPQSHAEGESGPEGQSGAGVAERGAL